MFVNSTLGLSRGAVHGVFVQIPRRSAPGAPDLARKAEGQLLSMGFVQSMADSGMFTRDAGGYAVYVIVYVDGLLIPALDESQKC